MSSHRRKIVAGNWKMNLDRGQARGLTEAVVRRVAEAGASEMVLCPPAVYIDAVASAAAGSCVAVGGQTVHDKATGAFTGEIAAPMLVDMGCRYVIVGHSERRTLFGETDAIVNAKAKAALASGLTPIVCVGETLEEREAGQTERVVSGQVRGSLAGLSAADVAKLVIAYEPVWAIGTGKVATPEQAQEVHAAIRGVLAALTSPAVAQSVRIQYGGSVKPDNAAELAAQPDIDGALVGGASLKADDFLGIAAAFGR